MPLTGPVSQGKKFFCPSCGALYAVTYKPAANKEPTVVKCVVCLKVMSGSSSANTPVYELIHRPEDA